MKVLVLAHDENLYGASRSLLTALTALAERPDRDLRVLCRSSGELGDALTRAGIEHEVVGFPLCATNVSLEASLPTRAADAWRYSRAMARARPLLERAARRFAPDVIYTNTSVVDAGHLLARRLGVPHVWHLREAGELFRYLPSRRRIARHVDASDRIVAVSRFVRDQWVRPGNPRCAVVRNGIPSPGQSRNTRDAKGPGSCLRLVMPAYVAAVKGQHVAIEALALLREAGVRCTLSLYGDPGDPAYFGALRASSARLGVDGALLWRPFDPDVDAIYDATDVLLSCGPFDSLGRTVVEAMRRGIPVVCNSAGAAREVLEDGTHGLLYDGSSAGLASAVRRLVDEPSLARQLAAGGLRAAQEFEVSHYVREIDRVLQEAVAGAADAGEGDR